jgi:hypothetical protein
MGRSIYKMVSMPLILKECCQLVIKLAANARQERQGTHVNFNFQKNNFAILSEALEYFHIILFTSRNII